MTRVLVLGANGLLGAHVARELSSDPTIDVVLASRDGRVGGVVSKNCVRFEYTPGSVRKLLARVGEVTHIANCVGMPSPRAGESRDVAGMFVANALLPLELADALRGAVGTVVHVSSDGVFSGLRASEYFEDDIPDDFTDYGTSKVLGEVTAAGFISLRTSVVGLAPWRRRSSFLDWLVLQPRNASVSGYTDYRWNGVTALALARLIGALIRMPTSPVPAILHIGSRESITKWQLACDAAAALGRGDLLVVPSRGEASICRILGTRHPELVEHLWKTAGYSTIPQISDLLQEYGMSRDTLNWD